MLMRPAGLHGGYAHDITVDRSHCGYTHWVAALAFRLDAINTHVKWERAVDRLNAQIDLTRNQSHFYSAGN